VRLRHARGFTLVEVLVALVVVALGLTALMLSVSGTARASGYLRDKAIAQWIALNRLTEVRLNLQQSKLGASGGTGSSAGGDTGELDFAGRHWHYDTRYFETSYASMHRVVVRVWPGPADQKGNALGEYTGFLGSDLASPGGSNVDWTAGSAVPGANCANTTGSTTTGTTTGTTTTTTGATGTNCTPAAGTTTSGTATTGGSTTTGTTPTSGGTTTTPTP
jgi:general secretion pathway protein I